MKPRMTSSVKPLVPAMTGLLLMSAFVVVSPSAPIAGTTNQMDADDPLARTRAAYGALKSYADTGVVFDEFASGELAPTGIRSGPTIARRGSSISSTTWTRAQAAHSGCCGATAAISSRGRRTPDCTRFIRTAPAPRSARSRRRRQRREGPSSWFRRCSSPAAGPSARSTNLATRPPAAPRTSAGGWPRSWWAWRGPSIRRRTACTSYRRAMV